MLQSLQAAFREQIWDHEQVQKIRHKFGELDLQTQSYVIIGSFAVFVLFLLLTFFVLWGRAISMKSELAAMDEQIRFVQNAGVQIEELQEQVRSQASDPLVDGIDLQASAAAFLEAAVRKSLIAKSNVEITESGKGADAKLNRISLTQLQRMLYLLEKAGAGTTVEKLTVDAKDDTEGYLWATLKVRK